MKGELPKTEQNIPTPKCRPPKESIQEKNIRVGKQIVEDIKSALPSDKKWRISLLIAEEEGDSKVLISDIQHSDLIKILQHLESKYKAQ